MLIRVRQHAAAHYNNWSGASLAIDHLLYSSLLFMQCEDEARSHAASAEATI